MVWLEHLGGAVAVIGARLDEEAHHRGRGGDLQALAADVADEHADAGAGSFQTPNTSPPSGLPPRGLVDDADLVVGQLRRALGHEAGGEGVRDAALAVVVERVGDRRRRHRSEGEQPRQAVVGEPAPAPPSPTARRTRAGRWPIGTCATYSPSSATPLQGHAPDRRRRRAGATRSRVRGRPARARHLAQRRGARAPAERRAPSRRRSASAPWATIASETSSRSSERLTSCEARLSSSSSRARRALALEQLGALQRQRGELGEHLDHAQVLGAERPVRRRGGDRQHAEDPPAAGAAPGRR